MTIQLGILKFILSYIFTDEERLRILIAGACDANHEVVSMSEDGIKRWTNNVDFESSNCIQSLYTMYLGTKGSGKSFVQACEWVASSVDANFCMVGAKDRQAPASIPVKIRILHFLSKSILATNMPTQMIQVIFDGIYGKKMTTTPMSQSTY